GAQVKYRIVRAVQMPWWWGWYGWRGRGGQSGTGSQEIAHGALKSETDGSFKIEFVAKPDLTVSEKDEPTFSFQIFADVTDSAGETRSNERTVNVGYTTLRALLSADEWQTDGAPVTLKVVTQTLDGEPQAAEGVVKVYELKAPEKTERPHLLNDYGDLGSDEKSDGDLSNPNNWPLGKVVAQKNFASDKNGKAELAFKLHEGAYRAVLETKDRFEKTVSGKLPIQVLQPAASKLGIRIPHLLAQKTNSFQPGDDFLALWGTGYDKGRAFIEIEHRQEMRERYWTKPGRTQQQIKVAVTEAMRGGFTVHVTQVRENRAYLDSRHVDVPWSNKELDIRWEHFTSKLQPNQKETWTAVISTPTNVAAADVNRRKFSSSDPKTKTNERLLTSAATTEKLVAEMVATLYDESLDAFSEHNWAQRFNIFRQDYSTAQPVFQNSARNFNPYWSDWNSRSGGPAMTYRHFPYDVTQNYWGYGYLAESMSRMGGRSYRDRYSSAMSDGVVLEKSIALALSPAAKGIAGEMKSELSQDKKASIESPPPAPPSAKNVDLNSVTARKNLNETAFFFPQLTSDSNGVVRMTFTMPEALTQWKFMGFAHDKNVRSGFIEGKTVTAKDLMVQPNPPRFLREGDVVEFTVKVSNQSEATQKGIVRLTFEDLLPASGSKSGSKAVGSASETLAARLG
ncbi:MAG: alpha-2-macroglobulin family protein, partial [Verrucomicrobiota bacterium]